MNNLTEKQFLNKPVVDTEKQLKINKKREAIKIQSPEISSDVIGEQSKKEVEDFVKVWGAVNKLGGSWYRIEGESKEKMTEWKNQIIEILNSFGNKKFHEKTNIYLDKILQNIERESQENLVDHLMMKQEYCWLLICGYKESKEENGQETEKFYGEYWRKTQ